MARLTREAATHVLVASAFLVFLVSSCFRSDALDIAACVSLIIAIAAMALDIAFKLAEWRGQDRDEAS